MLMMLFGGCGKIASLVLFFSLVSKSISSGPFAVDEFDESNEYRLPKNTKPTHYDVWLTVDVNKMKFFGSVKIILEALEKSNFVALNVKDVIVDHTNVTLMDDENQIYKPVNINNDVDTEIINFKFNHMMNVSSLYVLSVQFEGDIRNDTKGLYKSSYHHEGNTR
jgi:aminopeptidase 2